VGEETTTSNPDGSFAFQGLPTGPATIRATRDGYEAYESAITLPGRDVAFDIALIRTEIFEFGEFALYVPAHVSKVRGILVALGGPDTRAFSTSGVFGAPLPEVEKALSLLGVAYRSLAATHGLAILGTSRAFMPDAEASDQAIVQAIGAGAENSGRPDIESAPILMYGISGGAPEASGFVSRNSGRIAGLFLKVPLTVTELSGSALQVPTFLVLAEFDAFVDNASLAAQFELNRKGGGLWGMAKEPRMPHYSLSLAQRQLTVDWMRSVMELRVQGASGALRGLTESDGWLGDNTTGIATPWEAYTGDKSIASWIPTQPIALQWQVLVK
jgi:hypothetical protein